MRIILLVLAFSLLFAGCASNQVASNETSNITQNITQNQSDIYNRSKDWSRFVSKGFSFEYPADMNLSTIGNDLSGTITGQHLLDDRSSEMLTIRYLNTSWFYGRNKDGEFKSNPTKTAADFLTEDKKNDPTGFFMKASYMGNISTFSIGRDAYIAEMPFTLGMNSGANYTGYAMDIYIPERSLRIDVRITALDPAAAKNIRDNLLLGFRVE